MNHFRVPCVQNHLFTSAESMAESLRIAVADDERDTREWYEEVLPLLGHQVISAASTGAELVAKCEADRPDLIITDVKMPDLDGLDAVGKICETDRLPVIVVSAHHEPELIERATERHVSAYLVKPFKQPDIEAAIAVAISRFEAFEMLHQERDTLAQALEDRKKIERAKGILMQQTGLAEPDAFRRMQKLARSQNKKLVVIAESIITANDAFSDD